MTFYGIRTMNNVCRLKAETINVTRRGSASSSANTIAFMNHWEELFKDVRECRTTIRDFYIGDLFGCRKLINIQLHLGVN